MAKVMMGGSHKTISAPIGAYGTMGSMHGESKSSKKSPAKVSVKKPAPMMGGKHGKLKDTSEECGSLEAC